MRKGAHSPMLRLYSSVLLATSVAAAWVGIVRRLLRCCSVHASRRRILWGALLTRKGLGGCWWPEKAAVAWLNCLIVQRFIPCYLHHTRCYRCPSRPLGWRSSVSPTAQEHFENGAVHPPLAIGENVYLQSFHPRYAAYYTPVSQMRPSYLRFLRHPGMLRWTNGKKAPMHYDHVSIKFHVVAAHSAMWLTSRRRKAAAYLAGSRPVACQ